MSSTTQTFSPKSTAMPMAGTNQPFTANNAGSNNGSLTNGLLAVGGGEILVQGGLPISAVIPSIQSITLVVDSGPVYTATLNVVGACPSGSFDNAMQFTDQSGDTYSLRVYSSTVQTHTVSYNSSGPNITTITWDI
ncbi:MAG TPA: hypothetical protein VGF69_12610 [Thermoanaerobaculia bacterium]|jgi:hypothetical protein